MSPFVVIGETAKGKTNTLNIILEQISEKATVYLVDSKELSFYGCDEKDNIRYCQSSEQLEEMMEELGDFVEDRNAKFKEVLEEGSVIQPKEFYMQQAPYYLLVDDADDFIEMMEGDDDEYTDILKNAVECGLMFIVSANSAKLRGFDSLTAWIKTSVYGLVLSDQGINTIFPVAYDKEYPVFGDGLLFKNGTYERIRLPQYREV